MPVQLSSFPGITTELKFTHPYVPYSIPRNLKRGKSNHSNLEPKGRQAASPDGKITAKITAVDGVGLWAVGI